jgi:hypothetical protein
MHKHFFYINSLGTSVRMVIHYTDNLELMHFQVVQFQTHTVQTNNNNVCEMHAKFVLARKKARRDEGG